MKTNKHIGSKFDDFLIEEGIFEKVEAVAIKRTIALQLESAMRAEHLNKSTLASRMHTSRAALDRLFDPENEAVTLSTLAKAAFALKKELKVQFV